MIFFFQSEEFGDGEFDTSIKSVENSIAYTQIPFEAKTADPQNADIFLANTRSEKTLRLNDDSYEDHDLAWNKEGTKLLFTSRRRATKHLSLNPTILCIYDFSSGTERILENAISNEVDKLGQELIKQGVEILKTDDEHYNTSDPYWIRANRIGFLRRLPFGKGASISALCTSDTLGKRLKAYRDWDVFPKWEMSHPQWINEDSVLVLLQTPLLTSLFKSPDSVKSYVAIYLTRSNEFNLLTNDSERAFSPYLSYDKKKFLYTRIIKDTTELVLVNLRTKEEKVVPTQMPMFNAILSPHCEKIAFLRENGNDDDIYIMNVDGTKMRQITFDGGIKGSLAWCPNSVD